MSWKSDGRHCSLSVSQCLSVTERDRNSPHVADSLAIEKATCVLLLGCLQGNAGTMPGPRGRRSLRATSIRTKKSITKQTNGNGGVESIRGHAVNVMKTLGKGHSERVYHKAMITSLNKKRIFHRSEVLAPIYFMGEVVGVGRCDLVVGDLVVEIKANSSPPETASAQLQKYTKSLARVEGREFTGIVVNFNQRTGTVQVSRGRPAHGNKTKQRKG